MDNPADSLPGDHLRPEEREEVKEALRLHMQAHPAPTSQSQSFQEQFQKEAAALSAGEDILRSQEKAAFREHLIAFMDEHPLDVVERVPLNVRVAEMLTSLTRSLIPQTAAAFGIVLITGGSIAWAAEDTLPGDVLYSVKTGILEPMRAAMANTPADKAEKMAECARKRLLEAEKLLSGNRLTVENWQEIQTNMTANLDRADTLIVRIAETDPETAASLSADLNMMLDTYHQVFGEVGVVWENKVAVSAANDMNEAAVRFAVYHEQNEEKLLSDAAAAEILTKNVVHSVSSIINSLPAQKTGGADASASARDLLRSAEERLEKGEFRDSLKAARMAIRKTQKNEALLRLGISATISESADVSSSSSVATSVTNTKSAATTSAAAVVPASSSLTHSSAVSVQHAISQSSKQAAVSSIAPSSSAAAQTSSMVIELPLPEPVLPAVEEAVKTVPTLPSLLP